MKGSGINAGMIGEPRGENSGLEGTGVFPDLHHPLPDVTSATAPARGYRMHVAVIPPMLPAT